MLKRMSKVFIAVVMVVLASMVASPASATTSQVDGVCYDGAVWTPQLTASGANTLTPSPTSYYTTSSRCNDINFAIVSTPDSVDWSAWTRVCWVNHGTCNSWKPVPWDSNFHVIASNVLDGTRFRIETFWPESMWGSRWSTMVAY